MSQVVRLSRCHVRPGDCCVICGGTFRPIGAGMVECDVCHHTERAA